MDNSRYVDGFCYVDIEFGPFLLIPFLNGIAARTLNPGHPFLQDPHENCWLVGATQSTPNPGPAAYYYLNRREFNCDNENVATAYQSRPEPNYRPQYGEYRYWDPMPGLSPSPAAPSMPEASGINFNSELSPSDFLFASRLPTCNAPAQNNFNGYRLEQPATLGSQQEEYRPNSLMEVFPQFYSSDNIISDNENPGSSLKAPAFPRGGAFSLDRQAQVNNNNNHINNIISAHAPRPAEPTSDDFLQALADGEFSSPTSIPSGSTLAPPRRRFTTFYQNSLHDLFGGGASSPYIPNNNIDNDNMPARSKRSAPDPTLGRPVTRSGSRIVGEPIPIRGSSPLASTSRSRISPKRPVGTAASKSRAESDSTKKRGKKRHHSDDDAFASEDGDTAGLDLVDLSGENQVEEEPPKKNMVRLAQYQCVICIDNCTNLTVTQCGHVFCAECLHNALNVDRLKTICPICRQKLDLRNKSKNKKPFVHLELKLMSKTKIGKKPSRT